MWSSVQVPCSLSFICFLKPQTRQSAHRSWASVQFCSSSSLCSLSIQAVQDRHSHGRSNAFCKVILDARVHAPKRHQALLSLWAHGQPNRSPQHVGLIQACPLWPPQHPLFSQPRHLHHAQCVEERAQEHPRLPCSGPEQPQRPPEELLKEVVGVPGEAPQPCICTPSTSDRRKARQVHPHLLLRT